MAEKIYDITPTISEKLAVFPGDQPFQRKAVLQFAKGDHLELSHILSTVHLGAHADAPSHYHPSGVSIEKRPLGRYMGKAQVVHVAGLKPGQRIETRHISGVIRAPRVLVGTGSFNEPEKWNSEFNSFSPELLRSFSDQGVRLVGIDTPSVDPEQSKALESHQVLFERDMAVLEGLMLQGVPEGVYTLLALPLPIAAGDASPVRAVLLPYLEAFPEFE